MCWFVTVGVTPAGVEAIERLGSRRGALHVQTSSNAHVARIFGDGAVMFEVTTESGCSCDLYLGDEADRGWDKRARARHRRRGWSEAKIARAIEASRTAKVAAAGRDRESRPRRVFHDAVREHVRTFGRIRVFAHFYRGSPDDERVACMARRRLALATFLESGFPPDELIEIVDDAR